MSRWKQARGQRLEARGTKSDGGNDRRMFPLASGLWSLASRLPPALRVCRIAWQSSKLPDEVRFLGKALSRPETRDKRPEVGTARQRPSPRPLASGLWPLACPRPRCVPDSHATLRRSRTRFNSWRGHWICTFSFGCGFGFTLTAGQTDGKLVTVDVACALLDSSTGRLQLALLTNRRPTMRSLLNNRASASLRAS